MTRPTGLFLTLLILALIGCASPVHVARFPLQISEPPAQTAVQPVSIALVQLKRPLSVGQRFDEKFLRDFANGLENGLLQACRLVDPGARLVVAEQAGQADLLLIPTNPYLDVGRGTYNIEVTLSMERRLIQKGQAQERGILVEAFGQPGAARPNRQIQVLSSTYGLIGARVPGSPLERAINHALFEFSITFAQKLAKHADRYAQVRSQ